MVNRIDDRGGKGPKLPNAVKAGLSKTKTATNPRQVDPNWTKYGQMAVPPAPRPQLNPSWTSYGKMAVAPTRNPLLDPSFTKYGTMVLGANNKPKTPFRPTSTVVGTNNPPATFGSVGNRYTGNIDPTILTAPQLGPQQPQVDPQQAMRDEMLAKIMAMQGNNFGAGNAPTANIRGIDVAPIDLQSALGPQNEFNLQAPDFTPMLAPYGAHIDQAYAALQQALGQGATNSANIDAATTEKLNQIYSQGAAQNQAGFAQSQGRLGELASRFGLESALTGPESQRWAQDQSLADNLMGQQKTQALADQAWMEPVNKRFWDVGQSLASNDRAKNQAELAEMLASQQTRGELEKNQLLAELMGTESGNRMNLAQMLLQGRESDFDRQMQMRQGDMDIYGMQMDNWQRQYDARQKAFEKQMEMYQASLPQQPEVTEEAYTKYPGLMQDLAGGSWSNPRAQVLASDAFGSTDDPDAAIRQLNELNRAPLNVQPTNTRGPFGYLASAFKGIGQQGLDKFLAPEAATALQPYAPQYGGVSRTINTKTKSRNTKT